MKKEEVIQLLTLTKILYPSWATRLSKKDGLETIEVWQELLADEDYGLAKASLKMLASGEEEFPSVGKLLKRMRAIENADRYIDTEEAVAIVRKAVGNSYYNHKDQWSKLPKDIQMAVGPSENLKEWGLMKVEDFETVQLSHFRRGLRAVRERLERESEMPKIVRAMLDSRKKLELGGNSDD